MERSRREMGQVMGEIRQWVRGGEGPELSMSLDKMGAYEGVILEVAQWQAQEEAEEIAYIGIHIPMTNLGLTGPELLLLF
nr:hypothetical protein BaRGS_008833 [Batillaria attramentaria]